MNRLIREGAVPLAVQRLFALKAQKRVAVVGGTIEVQLKWEKTTARK